MKYIVTIALLLIGSIVMAGENCQKQTPSDTVMWFRAIDTTGWTNDGGHAWTPILDSVWHKKVPIYLTPAEILRLRDMLKRGNGWGGLVPYYSDTLKSYRWNDVITPCVQTYNTGSGAIDLGTSITNAILDSTILMGVSK